MKYGYSVTYTLGRSEQNGGDLFSLDFPRVSDYPRYPTGTDERHRLVMTGIFGLPWGFIASTFITLGSGTPYTIDDQSQGGGVNQRVLQRNGGRPEQFTFIFPDAWAYRSVDLQLEKGFHFGRPQRGVLDLPGLQHLQLRQFLRLPGIHPDAAGDQPELRPAEQPDRSRPAAAVRVEVRVLTLSRSAVRGPRVRVRADRTSWVDDAATSQSRGLPRRWCERL